MIADSFNIPNHLVVVFFLYASVFATVVFIVLILYLGYFPYFHFSYNPILTM